MEQPFIRDPEMTVEDRIKGVIAKVGENIVVRRFCRYQLGEGIERPAPTE
jgi:elongation factor Ts